MQAAVGYSVSGAAPDGRRISPWRAVAATGGLVLAGATAGALSGAVAALLAGALAAWDLDGFLVAVGAVYGFALGAVLGPVLGLGPLRRVPLGRAIGCTALAAALAGGASFVVLDIAAPLAGAAGAALTAVGLWYHERRQGNRPTPDHDA
ncbi:MAG: hypothetical protein ACJ8AO_14570 [Gemmatimonadaceae bacterium]